MKKILTLLLLAASTGVIAQKLDTLSIEKIMRDPKWIGISPSNIRWSDDSKHIYFNWNPNNAERDELYAVTPAEINPVKVRRDEQKSMIPEYGALNKKHTEKLYEKNGDIFLEDLKTGKVKQLTNTIEREANPTFSSDD